MDMKRKCRWMEFRVGPVAARLALLVMPVAALAQSDATLTGLTPSVGTLTPAFASNVFSYTASVPYVTASMTVTPTAADVFAAITVNGSPVASGSPSGDIGLSVGANVITTVVVSQDTSATNTYTLTVNRSANADLADLVPSIGTLNPAFASGIFSYTTTSPFTNDLASVTPTASDPLASIRVNGTPVASSTPFGPISLDVGANIVTIVVVSADTTATNTYTLNVIRDGPITVVNALPYTNNSGPSGGLYTVAVGYSVVGVDKLVVTAAGEHGFPNGVGVINSVTYAGTPMTLAIKLDNTQGAYKEAFVGIYYLDNPSQYGASGDIVVSVANANSFGASVMSLVGTAPGVDATSSALVTIPSLVESVSIVTKTEYNVVIAATENGTGNTGVQPFAQPPMTQVLSYVRAGARYTASGSGYQFVKGLANATSTFTNLSTTAATTLAASFGVAIPTLSWDIDGNTPGAGGATPAGSWDAATANWNANYLGTGDAANWTNGMAASFAAGTDATGTYTVTVDGTRDIAGLTFEEGEVTISGGTALRVSSFAVLNAAVGLTATVETPLSEDAAGRRLTKTGSGTIVLAGNNTYSGDTSVTPEGGTLVLAGTNTAATGGMTLNGGVTRFELPASINGTARNIAVNLGGVAAFGPSFGAGNIPAALSGRIVATSAGAIAADNYDSTAFDFSASGLTAASLGAVGNVNYTGTLTPSGTTYRLGGGGGTLTMANANPITGAGKSLVVNGNVTLPTANDFTAGTTLNVGTLRLGDDNCLGSGGLTVNGGVISSDSETARTVANAVTLSSDVTLGDAVNKGRLTFTGPAGLGAVNRVLTLNTDTELAGAVSGAGGALTKAGTSTLTLSGANTYSGATTVNKGTLVLLGSNNSAGTTLLNDGTTLQLGGSANGGLAGGALTFGALNATVLQPVGADRKITNTVFLTYIATAGGAALISGSQNLEISGTFTFASGGGGNRTLISSLDAGKALTLSGLVRLTDSGTARSQTISVTNEARITGVVTNGGAGAGSLIKSGPGLLVLANTNRYTGTTTAGGGVLQLNNDYALPGGIGTDGGTSALIFNGGVVGLGAGDFSRALGNAGNQVLFTGNGGWAACNANRLVNLGGASAPVDWAAATTGFNGKTLILGAASATHMVTLQNPLDLGTAVRTVQVADGAAPVDATLGGDLSGVGGGLTKTGSGTLALAGANTYSDATAVNAGTLLYNGSLAPDAGAVTVADGATLGGTGAIGRVVTVLDGGTLRPGDPTGALTVTGDLTIGAGATNRYALGAASARTDVNGNLSLAGTLDVVDAGGFAPGTYVLFTYTGTLTYTGVVTGSVPNVAYTYEIDTNTANQVRLVVSGGEPPLPPFDRWRSDYFGAGYATNPLAAADADPLGKGMSNTNQFLADLDPTNAGSRLEIVGILHAVAAGTRVDWIGGGTGAVQVLEARTAMPGGEEWTNLFSFTPPTPANPSSTNYVDPGGVAETNRFYRIRAYRP